MRIEGGPTMSGTTTEEWEISKDGKILTITLKEDFPTRNSNLGDVNREIGSLKVLKFKRSGDGI